MTCWHTVMSHEIWNHGIASQNNDSPCREHSLKVHQVNNMFICSFFKAWFTRSASLFTQAFSKSLHILNEWKHWSRLTPYYLKYSDVFGVYWVFYASLVKSHKITQSSEHHFAHPLPVLEPWELGLPCWLFFLPTFQCWIVGPSHVPDKLQTMASKRCHKHTTHHQRGAMTSDSARLPLNFAQRMHCLAIHMCVTRAFL